MRTSLRVLSLIVIAGFVSATKAQNSPVVNISEFDETTHLEFSGLENWNYEIERKSPGLLNLTLPALDPSSEERLKSYKDRFIKSIQVKREGTQTQVTFTLKEDSVEYFDYMTDEPSLLIVDLYKKAEDVEKSAESTKKTSSKKKAKNSKKTEAERKPASGELLIVEKEDPSVSLERRFGAFDSSDEEFGRFQIKDYEIKESAIIASRHNIYLKYPPLMMPVSRLDYWISNQPEYVIKPKDNRETKEAQLLQSLYLRGREAVFLKTYDYFSKKYPNSDYEEILQNLVADIYLKRWRKSQKPSDYDMAKDQLSDLIERYSDSPLTQRNRFLLAYANMERGEALPALESFQELLSLYPNSEETPHLKLAQAESLMTLKKYDDARAIYEQMIKDYPQSSFAAQARYRLGDVAMRAEEWKKAAKDYQDSLNALKKNEGDYPNAHFNRGEALFWMGKYKESADEFAQFLKLFPTHPYGAYAMTRIGELFDILGANKKRVMGAYLESYFRYPDLPGAKIARIRMLSKKMGSMKPKAFESAVEEIAKLQNELPIKDIGDFVTLLIAEGHEERGEYLASLELLSSFYQKHPNSSHRRTIQNRVRKNIADEIKKRVDGGNYLGALDFYEDYSKTWLQNSDRIDIDYYRARAYEQAGVLDKSFELYNRVAGRLEEISGTQEEKERRVRENLPTRDEVYLRIAKVLNDQREHVAAYKALKKISDPKNLNDKEKIERTQLMADLWIQRGDYEDAAKALELLTKDYQGKDEFLAPALVKQSQVQNHLKKWEGALKSADQALSMEDIPNHLRSQAYSEKVEAQLKLGLKASAIATLQEQLDEFEGKTPTEYVRYKLGELLYEEGDLAAAENVWQKLRDSESSVLWKIAEEKIQAAEFNKNYSRYIDRIPAMASQRENNEKSR